MCSFFVVNLYKCICILLMDYGMYGYFWYVGILFFVFLNFIYERFFFFLDLNRNFKIYLLKMLVNVFFLYLKLYNLKFKFKFNEFIESWFVFVDYFYEVK